MPKYDVAMLKRGDLVTVNGRSGVVVGPHEPEWMDHKTRAFRKELQGADIRFDGDAFATYIHVANIELIDAKQARKEAGER